MSVFTAAVHPGQALGFLVLGASLHDIITRLKAEPQRFPKIDIIYEPTAPVEEPILLNLPPNGLRLRFDGPEQRLRLIEVLDFTKSKLTYKDKDIFRAAASVSPTDHPSGPTFKHIYQNLIGPTFPGEYIEPESNDDTGVGLYILSYPGVAFSFPLKRSLWSPTKDVVSLLSAATSDPATSLAIFSGESWPEARESLYTQAIRPLKAYPTFSRSKESVPDDVTYVRIHGQGKLELVRPTSSGPFWVQLGRTTPQQLVAELGPPDAIYRKNDQRMSIHKNRAASGTYNRPDATEFTQDDSTDTDQSSAHTTTDDDEEEEEGTEDMAGNVSGECFYNYFYRGFDILLSSPSTPSMKPPSQDSSDTQSKLEVSTEATPRLVASKLILHGNIPGSYPFNRHRRCRWEVQYLNRSRTGPITSETPFPQIEESLHEEWKSIYKSAEEAKSRQRGMVLNRDWGDSPGSSCEFIGGWEEGLGGKRDDAAGSVKGLGNTTLFGFPGLVFEVLMNGTVSGLTVF